jgi:hypothetical protein
MRQKLLVLLILLAPAFAPASEEFRKLSVQEVKAKVGHKNVYIFDNNDLEVFKNAHLPTAKWLSPSDYNPKALPADKNATLIFYCEDEN